MLNDTKTEQFDISRKCCIRIDEYIFVLFLRLDDCRIYTGSHTKLLIEVKLYTKCRFKALSYDIHIFSRTYYKEFKINLYND